MKALMLLAMFTALAAGAFADAKPEIKSVKGAVVSYTAADAAKATPAVLVVKVADKEDSFVIDDKTVVEGKDKKAVDVATVKAGTQVDVKYTAADKNLDAVSVSLQ